MEKNKNKLQKRFINRWKEKCSKIEKLELSIEQAQKILDLYISERNLLALRKGLNNEKEKDSIFLCEYFELMTDLQLSLFQAVNNYNEKFPSFFNKFKSLKIKNIEYHNR